MGEEAHPKGLMETLQSPPEVVQPSVYFSPEASAACMRADICHLPTYDHFSLFQVPYMPLVFSKLGNILAIVCLTLLPLPSSSSSASISGPTVH